MSFFSLPNIGFVSWTVYSLYPPLNLRRRATELFQSPLYGSGTVFHSISRLLRHFLSSALAWRHASSNSVTRNYCCRARGHVNRSYVLTYLLTDRHFIYDILSFTRGNNAAVLAEFALSAWVLLCYACNTPPPPTSTGVYQTTIHTCSHTSV